MINVLMCTYNGERYLRQQIESILRQSYKDFRLYVRDDGSTDKTMAIVREYEQKYPSLIRIIDAKGHFGYPDCFWDLLKRCDKADLYAFCDQDDVWRRDKLECVVKSFAEEINTLESDADKRWAYIPTLYIHEYYNCDKNLNPISCHNMGGVDVLTDRSVLFYTYASGFSMVINDAMRSLLNGLPIMGHDMYHDELCIWMAHFYGRIIYDDRILAKYRRHESTETKYGNGIPTLIKKYMEKEILGDYFISKCRRTRHFLKFENTILDSVTVNGKGSRVISSHTKREWTFLTGNRTDFSGKLKRIFYMRRLRPTWGGELALRILFAIK